jgi:hypothetical protein
VNIFVPFHYSITELYREYLFHQQDYLKGRRQKAGEFDGEISEEKRPK